MSEFKSICIDLIGTYFYVRYAPYVFDWVFWKIAVEDATHPYEQSWIMGFLLLVPLTVFSSYFLIVLATPYEELEAIGFFDKKQPADDDTPVE